MPEVHAMPPLTGLKKWQNDLSIATLFGGGVDASGAVVAADGPSVGPVIMLWMVAARAGATRTGGPARENSYATAPTLRSDERRRPPTVG